MPPTPTQLWRRQHIKSRRGCLTCKARKVKCDETHPHCRNCRRLGIGCDFAGGDEPRLPLRWTPSRSTVTPSPSPPPRWTDTSRTDELRLLHHYLTHACHDFPLTQDATVMHLFTVTVPQLAFAHEFLLDAVLSAAAFHLARGDARLTVLGHAYYGQAVSKHRQALTTIEPATADALCWTSVFVMLLTFKIACLRPPEDRYAPPTAWFRVVVGMGRLFHFAGPMLDHDGVRLLLARATGPFRGDGWDAPVMPVTTVTPVMPPVMPVTTVTPVMPPVMPPLEELLETASSDGPAADSIRQFGHALEEVSTYAQVGGSRHNVRCHLLTIAATSDEQFLDQMQDTVALVLISHYFALLQWAGGNWWLQSGLEAELQRLRAAVPSEHRWAVADSWSAARSRDKPSVLAEQKLV